MALTVLRQENEAEEPLLLCCQSTPQRPAQPQRSLQSRGMCLGPHRGGFLHNSICYLSSRGRNSLFHLLLHPQ